MTDGQTDRPVGHAIESELDLHFVVPADVFDRRRLQRKWDALQDACHAFGSRSVNVMTPTRNGDMLSVFTHSGSL